MEELVHLTNQTNLPLSSNQVGLWIISQQNLSNPAYNIQITYHFRGEINLDIVRQSLNILFDRQQVLFSVFKQKEGVPYIEIRKRPIDIELIDFSTSPPSERREKILSFAGENIRKVFDLENGPLYRFFLFKEDEKSYFLQVVIHHLIFDGQSRRILVQELSRIYTSIANGDDHSREPLKYSSFDYSQKMEGALPPEKEQELVDFWKEYLKDCPPELKFPYDFHRKSEPSGLGCRIPFRISAENTEKLRALSQEANVSLFNTMLSAVGIIFQKYTGSDDICIGVPVSSRRDDLMREIFGMFVNTIGVRLKVDRAVSFKDEISLVRHSFKRAITRSDLPFEKIVKAVNPERIPGVNPFYQVSFTWHNGFTLPMNFAGIPGEAITVEKGISFFDFTFYMWENGDFIDGEIGYDVDIIKHETALRFRDHFLTLIDNLMVNPEAPLSSVSILTDEDKRLISRVNDTRTDYPRNRTIAELFEGQSKMYPDKPALVYKDNIFTYRELNERANQIAWMLRELGVDKSTPVALIAEKSAEMIVAILGILKAGCGYVPIDPEYPEERINFIVSDSGCRVILTNSNKSGKVNIPAVKIFHLGSENAYHHNKSDLDIINTPSDLAYIIYTSGTTGTPKGATINQQGVVRLVRNTNYIDITAEDRVLSTSAIVFDAATFEIWGALLNGGTLYIAEKETILNPKELGAELDKNRITILWLTSALFTHIAESRVDIFGKLKYLLVGGDVISAPHINKVRNANPGLKVVNGYGPTENTTFSTAYLIEKDFEHNIPIGKPISNSTAYIFDKSMNYQPIGVIGELYVGGDGVAAGYLNRDDLNRKNFIDNPYVPGERLYRTGDYARWLPDGNIAFHGRVDNQLKIRGFRVELDEIEAVISRIDGVIETVVKPVKIDVGDYMLIAFLNVQAVFNLDSNEIGRMIKKRLPSYMMPAAYKLMQGFPRTINGKIDRNALVYDLKELETRESKEVKTLTPTEKIIHRIWSETLKINGIAVTDNFFEIGGNSLVALSVFSKITAAFKVEMSLRVFFDSPRIKDLAEVIDIQLRLDTKKGSVDKSNMKNANIIKGEI